MTQKMNALRNKKGFTLIEMLVVVAIISVLVAVIIPVIGNSTDKAAAAANAANLRSLQAEASTLYLTADKDTLAGDGVEGSCFVITKSGTADPVVDIVEGEEPTFKQIGDMTGVALTIDYENNQFVAKCAGKTVDDFAKFAETGAFPEA